MVEQGRRGMKCCNNHQRMGKNLMHLLAVARECAIPGPGRCNVGEAKYWKSVATRELPPAPGDGNWDQQPIKELAIPSSSTVSPFSSPQGFGGRGLVRQI